MLAFESSAPVGSSAKTTSGFEIRLARQRLAAADRPRARRVPQPVAEVQLGDHGLEPGRSTARPARSAGSVMFSSAVSVGSRLNDWKTKPSRSRRRIVRSRSESDAIGRADEHLTAGEGVQAGQAVHQVDLPEPEGP